MSELLHYQGRIRPYPEIKPQDLAILRSLLMTPFQRHTDLAYTLQVHPVTIYRAIAHLQYLEAVASITASSLGSKSCQVWHLTDWGLHLIAGGDRQQSATLARVFGAQVPALARLIPRLPALHTLQSTLPVLVNAGNEALKATAPHQRLAHQAQQRGQREATPPVQWQWVRDYRHTFAFRGEQTSMAVDGVFVLHLRSTPTPNATTSQATDFSMRRTNATTAAVKVNGAPDTVLDIGDVVGWCVWLLLDPGVGTISAVL